MKKLSILLFSLLVIGMGEETWGTDLRGRFAVSGTGGLSGIASGFQDHEIKHAYGVGISTEYFFLKWLSGGLMLSHNVFQGEWRKLFYDWRTYYSSDWSWTNLSMFGRFTGGPENKLSPYLKAGVGLYFPRVKDWAFYAPDTVYTHSSYGKGQFGYHFGMGVQCRLVGRLMVFIENSFHFIYTEDLVIHWVDLDQRLEWDHFIDETSRYINWFAGVSVLL